MVARNMRMPPTPLASSDVVFPVRPRCLKMNLTKVSKSPNLSRHRKEVTYGCIVEDGVDSGPCEAQRLALRIRRDCRPGKLTLLENHDEHRNDHSLEERSVSQETGVLIEAQFDLVQQSRSVVLREASSRGLNLKAMLCLHLQEFELNQFVVGRQTADLADDSQAFILPALGHEPTGTGRHEQDANTQCESWNGLDTDRNQPGSIGLAWAGATDVVCAVS